MKKLILAFGLLTAPSLAFAKAKPTPTITMAEATKTALARVERGTIKSSELEEEKGKLIYSFDIVGKDKQIVEVNVDAYTGAVLSVENETADKERAEEEADKKKSPKR